MRRSAKLTRSLCLGRHIQRLRARHSRSQTSSRTWKGRVHCSKGSCRWVSNTRHRVSRAGSQTHLGTGNPSPGTKSAFVRSHSTGKNFCHVSCERRKMRKKAVGGKVLACSRTALEHFTMWPMLLLFSGSKYASCSSVTSFCSCRRACICKGREGGPAAIRKCKGERV